MKLYKLSDMGENKLAVEVFETMRKEPGAREACDWIDRIEKNYERLLDEAEGCFLFCNACYLVTVRDIDVYEVRCGGTNFFL
jgi:hypothetical protein